MKNLTGARERQRDRTQKLREPTKSELELQVAILGVAMENRDEEVAELRAENERLRAESRDRKIRHCSKCNGTIISLRYDRGAEDCLRENRACGMGEHLHFCCSECGYDWCGPIEPPKKAKSAPGKG